MSFHEQNVVHKEIRITAPIEQVWEAWTEPSRLCQWFTDSVDGWPGQGSTLSMTWSKFGFTVNYKIAELVPRKRLVLKTRLPGVGTQVLTIEFSRRAPETIVSLSESGPENSNSDPLESGVDSGWTMALAILKYYVENHYAQNRQKFFALLPASFSYDHLLTFLTTEEGLACWLTRSGSLPGAGQAFELVLDDGTTMSGTVLALTHHEMALSWEQINGYVEFKSFPLGDGAQKALCIRGAGYEIGPERVQQIEEFAKDALVKLFAAVAGPAPAELP